MKSQAAVLYELKSPLTVEELQIPELKSGQVLVRVAFSGVCHTQLNEIHGLKGEDKFLPHTLGHEGAGIVEEIGAGVTKVKPGDHVVITWIQGSGANVPATTYVSQNGLKVNSGAVSTFMEYSIVAENRVVKIGAEMPLKVAALLGCAVPTGAGIVLKCDPDKTLESVAIFGAGGIGLSAIIAAQYRGIKRIFAIDISKKKLEQAAALGATDVINASEQDPLSEILRLNSNCGLDLSIESAGKKETMETAYRATRDNGGMCVLAGNLPHGQQISIDPLALIKGKRLVGSWGGGTNPDEDIPFYANLYVNGKLKLDGLITHQYKLSEINSACDDLMHGRTGRALLSNESN